MVHPADVDISARTGTINYRTVKEILTGPQAATTTSGTKLEAANDNYGEIRVTIRTESDLEELAVKELIGAQAIDIKEYAMKKLICEAANGNYGKTTILSHQDTGAYGMKKLVSPLRKAA